MTFRENGIYDYSLIKLKKNKFMNLLFQSINENCHNFLFYLIKYN